MLYEPVEFSAARAADRVFCGWSDGAGSGRFAGHSAEHSGSLFLRLRWPIASKLASYELSGQIEADESYFGGWRKGKRGRGAEGKVAVFSLLKRRGNVFTAVIVNARSETLIPPIREKVLPIRSCTRTYFLPAMDVSGFHHLRAKHSELFADQKKPVIGIENFWTQAKRHLHRFNGIQPANFTGSSTSATALQW